MNQTVTYLDTKQLAKRYGVTDNTVKIWRMKTRKENKQVGPEWYELPKFASTPSASRVRYNLDQVIAWEKENNITPKENGI